LELSTFQNELIQQKCSVSAKLAQSAKILADSAKNTLCQQKLMNQQK